MQTAILNFQNGKKILSNHISKLCQESYRQSTLSSNPHPPKLPTIPTSKYLRDTKTQHKGRDKPLD